VDDMFSTPDGTILAVSRPSFADVVGIDLRTRKIVWWFKMHGQRADHMAVNPRGTRLLVSDSTANHVDELDLRTGRPLRQFPSGDIRMRATTARTAPGSSTRASAAST